MIGGYGIDPRPVVYLNVSVKPLSGKYSWTRYSHKAKADRDLQSSLAARAAGRHTRCMYRVNCYIN